MATVSRDHVAFTDPGATDHLAAPAAYVDTAGVGAASVAVGNCGRTQRIETDRVALDHLATTGNVDAASATARISRDHVARSGRRATDLRAGGVEHHTPPLVAESHSASGVDPDVVPQNLCSFSSAAPHPRPAVSRQHVAILRGRAADCGLGPASDPHASGGGPRSPVRHRRISVGVGADVIAEDAGRSCTVHHLDSTARIPRHHVAISNRQTADRGLLRADHDAQRVGSRGTTLGIGAEIVTSNYGTRCRHGERHTTAKPVDDETSHHGLDGCAREGQSVHLACTRPIDFDARNGLPPGLSLGVNNEPGGDRGQRTCWANRGGLHCSRRGGEHVGGGPKPAAVGAVGQHEDDVFHGGTAAGLREGCVASEGVGIEHDLT